MKPRETPAGPPLTPLSLAILGLLEQEPRSGYDLRKIFATTPMGYFSSSPGAIYPALRRLERARWIRGSVDRAQPLRPRQVFALTAGGGRILREALARSVTRADVAARFDELLLRFAFAGRVLGRRHTLAFLRELLARVGSHVRYLRAQVRALPESAIPYGRLALEQGLESYQATGRWLRRAIRELEEPRTGPARIRKGGSGP
jgi:DNA-binding PadR family transcriptional regulator